MNRGFTLTEVLVALLIVSIAVLVLAKMQVLSIRGTGYNKQATTATVLAQKVAEDFKVAPFGTKPGSCDRKEEGMTVTCEMSTTGNAPYRSNNMRVRVTWGGTAKPDLSRNGRCGKIAGVSLLEILVGLALAGLITVAAYSFFGSQQRSYLRQDETAEMQQNLRVALEKITRDLTMAGFGKPLWSTVNGEDLSAWYNEPNAFRPVKAGSTLEIVGCSSTADGTLSLMEFDGSSARITLEQNASTVAASFNTTKRSDISIGGRENAKVTKVEERTLTVQPRPTRIYPAGTELYVVRHVTYSTGVSGDVPVLFIDEHLGAHRQALCQFITGLTTTIDGGKVTVRVSGQTRSSDKTTGDQLASTMSATATIRNP